MYYSIADSLWRNSWSGGWNTVEVPYAGDLWRVLIIIIFIINNFTVIALRDPFNTPNLLLFLIPKK